MAPLGPYEPRPHLALAVSGGADSLALTLLARDWASACGGRTTALVVDHALRPASAAEAELTLRRLASLGIPARLLTLTGLSHGPALAARARAARHAALEAACAEAGILHLLLGHHAADQAETHAMRARRQSAGPGLAAMAVLSETRGVRRLRPLLPIPPGRLRATLRAAGLAWVEDPSNANPAAERNRLRLARAEPDGDGPATRADLAATLAAGTARTANDDADAAWLATHASLSPAGHALLAPVPFRPTALATLLRTIAGRPYPPPPAAIAAWAAAPNPATLAGCRLLPAGRLRPGAWLIVREAAALAPPVPATSGCRWDNRFHLTGSALPEGLTLGALGPDSARLRDRSPLPAAALWPMPALRRDGCLFAVPHIGYGERLNDVGARILFDPPAPARGAPFLHGRVLMDDGPTTWVDGDANGIPASYVGSEMGDRPDAG